jgi:hypothetical protein
MLTIPTFTEGDTARPLTGVVSAGKQPVDITGSAVEAHILRPDRETVLSVTAAIEDGPAGAWIYQWGDTDLSVVGIHEVEVEVTFPSGRPETFGPQKFKVRAQFA